VWGEDAEQLYGTGDLVKGCEVYAEGRIRLNEWTGQDGQKRSGLNLSAWKLEPLGADGPGFVAAYRARPGPHAPVVLMTGAEGARRWDGWADALGVAAVLPKPFGPDELDRAVGAAS
jgi:CheY-like chemotaxis protein